MCATPADSRPWTSPEGWERKPLGGWLPTAVVAGLAAVVALPTVSSALTGDGARAGVLAGVLIVLVVIAVLARPKTRSAPAVPVATEVDGVRVHGVRFPVRPASRLVSAALILAGLAFLALGIAAVVVSLRDGEAQLILGFLVLGGIGAVLLLGGVAGLRASRTDLGIDLTPEHVIVGLGLGRLVVPWAEIARIEAMSIRIRARVTSLGQVQHWLLVAATADSATLADRRSGTLGNAVHRVAGDVVVAVPTERMGSDPVVVYHALRHYLRHADQRDALADGAAQRWLAGATSQRSA